MYEEKDWLMRQIRRSAEGLGNLLTKNSIKEILMVDQKDKQAISDEEINVIIALTDVSRKRQQQQISDDEFYVLLGISKEKWLEIDTHKKTPTDTELAAIQAFLK